MTKNTLTVSRPNAALLQSVESPPLQPQAPVLHAVLESLIDGILIVTEQGKIIHANDCARQICRQFTADDQQPMKAPSQIWRICESLIESRHLFPDQTVVIEEEIVTDQPVPIRVRARWLELKTLCRPCLLVTLEDRYQSARKRAIAEVKQYGLTPREADVWLLRRANYTYEEIAQKLYIALNTVKKHIKSIHAKRQDTLSHRMFDESMKAL